MRELIYNLVDLSYKVLRHVTSLVQGASTHIFRICLVQNCLSQGKISETVKSFWFLKLSVI